MVTVNAADPPAIFHRLTFNRLFLTSWSRRVSFCALRQSIEKAAPSDYMCRLGAAFLLVETHNEQVAVSEDAGNEVNNFRTEP
jgi:hypothetical protein